MAETFTCEACGQTFPMAWTDAEARAEAAEVFGGPPPPSAAVVCDGCYQAIMAMAEAKGWPRRWDDPG